MTVTALEPRQFFELVCETRPLGFPAPGCPGHQCPVICDTDRTAGSPMFFSRSSAWP